MNMMNITKILLTVMLIIALTLVGVYGQAKRQPTSKRATKSKPPATQPPEVSSTASAEKTPFVSADGRFSIALPPDFATFEQSRETHQTPYGETLTVVTYKAHDVSGKDLVDGLVMYIDYPARIFREQSLWQILQTAQSGTLASLGKTTVLKEERFLWLPDTNVRLPVSKGAGDDDPLAPRPAVGVPGTSVFVSVQDGLGRTYGRFDIFVVKPRAYAISLVYSNRAAFNRPAVKNFFDSFRVTPVR